MTFMRTCAVHAAALVIVAAVSACESERAWTPPPSPTPLTSPQTGAATRIIRVSESVDFGDVELGSDATKEFPICNDGNSTVTIYEIIGPEPFFFYLPAYWDYNAETIAPGGCKRVTGGFRPPALGSYSGTFQVVGDQTSGMARFVASGTGSRPPSPRTTFGEGRFLVGVGVAPGRYFSDPNGECYWERQTTSGGWTTFQTWFDPGQWVVDILPSDEAFASFAGCGWWSPNPVATVESNVITPGVWLVREQVAQGRYRANARPGCSWARLRHFDGTSGGVIESATDKSGEITVSIRSTDAGFLANEACGRWTRVS